MYVTVTSAKTSDQPLENATIVAEEMMRWLRDIEGFEGFLMLSQEGRTLGLSFWESLEAAERHRVARAQFRERMLSVADVEIEDSSDFEVTFADLGRRLAELSR
jgi:heme-degrading monooxygenase HmoA